MCVVVAGGAVVGFEMALQGFRGRKLCSAMRTGPIKRKCHAKGGHALLERNKQGAGSVACQVPARECGAPNALDRYARQANIPR